MRATSRSHDAGACVRVSSRPARHRRWLAGPQRAGNTACQPLRPRSGRRPDAVQTNRSGGPAGGAATQAEGHAHLLAGHARSSAGLPRERRGGGSTAALSLLVLVIVIATLVPVSAPPVARQVPRRQVAEPAATNHPRARHLSHHLQLSALRHAPRGADRAWQKTSTSGIRRPTDCQHRTSAASCLGSTQSGEVAWSRL